MDIQYGNLIEYIMIYRIALETLKRTTGIILIFWKPNLSKTTCIV